MRQALRLSVLLSAVLLAAGTVLAVDPPDDFSATNPQTNGPKHMQLRVGNTEPGPIDLPVVRPAPIMQPLDRAGSTGAPVPGGALPSMSGTFGGSGDASSSVDVTERRLRKLIRKLDDSQ